MTRAITSETTSTAREASGDLATRDSSMSRVDIPINLDPPFYQGRCIALELELDDPLVITRRATYALEGLKLRTAPADIAELNGRDFADLAKLNAMEFWGQGLVLAGPHLVFSRACELVRKAREIVDAGLPVGSSIVCTEEKVTVEFLRAQLDFSIQHYYNDADYPDRLAPRSTPPIEMIFLFDDGLSKLEKLELLDTFENELLTSGLSKGIVALGRDDYVTVFATANGPKLHWWNEGFSKAFTTASESLQGDA